MRLYRMPEGLPESPEAAELLLAMRGFIETTQAIHARQKLEEQRWDCVLTDQTKREHAEKMGKTIAKNLEILNEVDQQLLDEHGIVTAVPHAEHDGLVGVFGFSYSPEHGQYVAVVGDNPESPENYHIAPDALRWVPQSLVTIANAMTQGQQSNPGA